MILVKKIGEFFFRIRRRTPRRAGRPPPSPGVQVVLLEPPTPLERSGTPKNLGKVYIFDVKMSSQSYAQTTILAHFGVSGAHLGRAWAEGQSWARKTPLNQKMLEHCRYERFDQIFFSGFSRTLKGLASAKTFRENIRWGQMNRNLWAQNRTPLYVPKWGKDDQIGIFF